MRKDLKQINKHMTSFSYGGKRVCWILFICWSVPALVQGLEAHYHHNPFKEAPVFVYDLVKPVKKENRPLGALVGLAIGDMLGASLELLERGSYAFDAAPSSLFKEALWPTSLLKIFLDPYKARHFNSMGWQPGEWSEDTSSALCLIASLLENGFHLKDQLDRWVRWRQSGYMSFRKSPPDVGLSFSRVLDVYQKKGLEKDFDLKTLGTHNKHAFTQKLSEGNSVMARVTPLVLWASSLKELKETVTQHAQLTHGSTVSIQSALVIALVLWKGLHSQAHEPVKIKEDMLSLNREELETVGVTDPKVLTVALSLKDRDWKTKSLSHLKATGFSLDSLECALGTFYHTNDPQTGLKEVLLLGSDTSTIAAITGQLMGMCYGLAAFPSNWQQYLWGYDIIITMGRELLSSPLKRHHSPFNRINS